MEYIGTIASIRKQFYSVEVTIDFTNEEDTITRTYSFNNAESVSQEAILNFLQREVRNLNGLYENAIKLDDLVRVEVKHDDDIKKIIEDVSKGKLEAIEPIQESEVISLDSK